MALMPQVLVGRQLRVHTLRLEYHADSPPQGGGLAHRVHARHESDTGARHHQGGKNPEEGGLAAAVWSKKPKQFRRTNVKRNPVQRGPVFVPIGVAMHQVAHGNDRGAGLPQKQVGRGALHRS